MSSDQYSPEKLCVLGSQGDLQQQKLEDNMLST